MKGTRPWQDFRLGVTTTLGALPRALASPGVRRAYFLVILALVLVIALIDFGGIWASWHFISGVGGDSWLWESGRFIAKAIAAVVIVLLAPLVGISLCNVLFPVFSEVPFLAGMEVVSPSRAQQLRAGNGLPVITVIGLSAWRLFLSLCVALGAFLVGLIPVAGPFLAPGLSFYFASRLVGAEMLDPYFDRLGLPPKQQKVRLREHSAAVLGHGAVCALVLAVPVMGALSFGLLQATTAFFVREVLEKDDTPDVANAARSH